PIQHRLLDAQPGEGGDELRVARGEVELIARDERDLLPRAGGEGAESVVFHLQPQGPAALPCGAIERRVDREHGRPHQREQRLGAVTEGGQPAPPGRFWTHRASQRRYGGARTRSGRSPFRLLHHANDRAAESRLSPAPDAENARFTDVPTVASRVRRNLRCRVCEDSPDG